MGVHHFHGGPEDVIQQQIALDGIGFLVPRQHQVAVETQFGAGGGGLSAVVALRAGALDDYVRALVHRIANGVLQLPGLVPTEGEAGAVVPLDPEIDPP